MDTFTLGPVALVLRLRQRALALGLSAGGHEAHFACPYFRHPWPSMQA
jgi:hypothetical protein